MNLNRLSISHLDGILFFYFTKISSAVSVRIFFLFFFFFVSFAICPATQKTYSIKTIRPAVDTAYVRIRENLEPLSWDARRTLFFFLPILVLALRCSLLYIFQKKKRSHRAKKKVFTIQFIFITFIIMEIKERRREKSGAFILFILIYLCSSARIIWI